VEYFMERAIDKIINQEACTVIKTRGGFHLLVKSELVTEPFQKIWWSELFNLEEGGCTPSGDMIMPIPGCVQGGYSPFFVLKDGVKQ
jgi:hypothetical protein